MRRTVPAVMLAALAVGCGASHHAPPSVPGSVTAPAQHYPLAKANEACPTASAGHGAMGGCAPLSLGLKATLPTVPAGVTFPDLSNNDPCVCGAAIKAAGHKGLVVKANQGTGFIDRTAAGMVASARSAGLAVGAYDFDQDYTVAEAKVFVARLKAMGILPRSRNTFPAVFDVEYGSFSLSGLRAQIAYVKAQGYRVAIYTGGWYWGPHAGCTWPGVPAWLAGYPSAPVFCGLAGSLYHDHQYTERGTIAAGHSGDVSVHFGSSFAAFVNAGPAPKPPSPRVAQRAHLRRLYAERTRLRRRGSAVYVAIAALHRHGIY